MKYVLEFSFIKIFSGEVVNADDYDDVSISADIFGEDMISLSWSASFHSQHDLDDRTSDDCNISIRPDVDDDVCESVSEVEIEDEKTEQRVPEKKTRKRRSVGRYPRNHLLNRHYPCEKDQLQINFELIALTSKLITQGIGKFCTKFISRN